VPSGYPTDPKIAATELRAAGAIPCAKFPGVGKPWESRCRRCKKTIFPRLTDVRQGHRPCNFCASSASSQTRRVPAKQAQQEMLAANLQPLEPYSGAGRPWQSKCLKCGRIGSTRLASIRRGHVGCRSCATRGKGMVDPVVARKTMIKKGRVLPLTEYPGNDKPWLCRCLECRAEVTPVYSSVASSGRGGCKYCGRRRGARTRTIPSERAIKIMLRGGATPLTPYVDTKTPWKSRCNSCGATISPTLGNIKNGAGPCKFCAEHGFNYRKPAVIYLLHHQKERAYKVGISGLDTGRIKMLQQLGWRCLTLRKISSGKRAAELEIKMLERLIVAGASPEQVPKARMPRGGHTETFRSGKLSRVQILRIFQATR
jgi:hypothetical protein